MDEPAELTTLRRLAASVADAHGVAPYEVMWGLGFELLEPLQNFGYHCTPVHSVAFGATGGDGIHLSLLTGAPLAGAVVLTVPVGDIPNTVVGESFTDFLRMGYFAGFSWLEELGYLGFDRAAADVKYREDAPCLGRSSRDLLARMRSTFALRPWENVGARLDELESQYLSGLLLPDFEAWRRRHGV